MKIAKFFTTIVLVGAALAVTSCSSKKFHIEGNITNAKDSMLYLENISLNGPVKIDSMKLDEKGAFDFTESAADSVCPNFYRLRIAGQSINLSIDSTETVTVNARWPQMSTHYTVKGSDDCSRIKELSLMQMQLQGQINAIAQNPSFGIDSSEVAIGNLIDAYKNKVKIHYIFKEPMKASSYYALFQTVQIGGQNTLIFNPQASKSDVQVFAAVATSWDTFYPGSQRGKNLHQIALQGMKNIRIVAAQQAQKLASSQVSNAGLIDLQLPDNKNQVQTLSSLKGQVVMLDFHLFASDQSMQRIMWLRGLYDKYHKAGFEIYQVSVDPDESFWRQQTASLPWICVRDQGGVQGQSLQEYNVQTIPTYFLIDRNNVLQKRDVQVKNIDQEIQALLKR
ncbi:MAG: AhpC/TSA family protein [Prevotella sp.]|jgi:peroxiredoxin|nr:TlpA disulfide reductase family protein [Prevotella sp.]MCH3969599.1 AhpC/TSA family protein [Prevotella sp.]MCH3985107.1 AhpC/TSA family protein [Prevotella sp.]MCH4019005.1 AhpC/TSA family protein [Prevotella sp.]MCH4099402.1 AhpC/TSA family protein [Prevotella sp.]MCH4215183.1 AhpC/TSA family protein [Prevotella sp.]